MTGTNIQINLVGNVFEQLNLLTDKLKIVNNSFSAIQTISKKAFNDIQNNIKVISATSLANATTQLAESFQLLTAPGIEFQQKIAELSAITGITGKDLEELSKKAREVGKSTGLGAAQAAEAFKLLASNVDVSKIRI